MNREQGTIARWEDPFEGGRYLVTCDPMTGAEQVTGTGEKDRHAVFVLRDAYTDQHQTYHRLKVVARIKAPCQWESEVLAEQLWWLSRHYGGATIPAAGTGYDFAEDDAEARLVDGRKLAPGADLDPATLREGAGAGGVRPALCGRIGHAGHQLQGEGGGEREPAR